MEWTLLMISQEECLKALAYYRYAKEIEEDGVIPFHMFTPTEFIKWCNENES